MGITWFYLEEPALPNREKDKGNGMKSYRRQEELFWIHTIGDLLPFWRENGALQGSCGVIKEELNHFNIR